MANWLYNGVELPALYLWSGEEDRYPYATIWKVQDTDTYRFALTSLPLIYDASVNGLRCDQAVKYYQGYRNESFALGWSWSSDGTMQPDGYLSDVESVLWSSADVLTPAGTVYLAGSQPVSVDCDLRRYGDAELQKLPEVEGCPYVAIRKDTTNGRYEAIFSATGFYMKSATVLCDKTNTHNQRYTVNFVTVQIGAEWEPNDPSPAVYQWGISDAKPLLWANHDILNADGSVYLLATNPITVDSKLGIAPGNIGAASAAVDFTCSGLNETDSVYAIQAWVYPKGESYRDPVASYASSSAFGGPAHTERGVFAGLSPATDYELYAVITADGVATEHNALLAFTTAESDIAALSLSAGEVSAEGFLLTIIRSGLDEATTYNAEVLVYNAATSRIVFEADLTVTGNGTAVCAVTGLEPLTEYGVSVDVYPASGGANVVRGDLTVTTGKESALCIYAGVEDVARAVGSVYIGVNGVARAVKSVYIGVNGVATPVTGG